MSFIYGDDIIPSGDPIYNFTDWVYDNNGKLVFDYSGVMGIMGPKFHATYVEVAQAMIDLVLQYLGYNLSYSQPGYIIGPLLFTFENKKISNIEYKGDNKTWSKYESEFSELIRILKSLLKLQAFL